LASYQANLDELTALEATVVAVSVEDLASTKEMVEKNGLTFPVAYDLREAQVAAYHPLPNEDHHGRYLQPMEFLVLRNGTIFGSMYASGPVGRMGVEEVLNSIKSREHRRLESEGDKAGKVNSDN